jgi:peroxiredoxin Q/BCP
MLKKGSKAPAFTGIDQDGNTISLKDFIGKKLILFFYPKDNTPTCTVEACNLRDNYADLTKKGFSILGVSADSVKSHTNFIAKNSLPFSLISDKENKVINAYKVWGEKMMYGKTYEGILRTTFVINELGKIELVIDKVESKNHAEQILELLQQ